MRVLFISSTFPRKKGDPEVPWMQELVGRLITKKVKVDIFAPAYQGLKTHQFAEAKVYRFRYGPKFLEVLTHEEGAVFKIREKPWLVLLSPFYLLFGGLALFSRVRQMNYDVINIHWPFPHGLWGLLLKKASRAKIVLTFHGAEFTLMKKIPFGKNILKLILLKADQVIANSNFTKKEIRKIASVPVKIIPFASAIPVKKQKRKFVNQPPPKQKKILFVGRLIERKGVAHLIKAMKQSNAQLNIVGGGLLLAKLSQQVKEMGLEKKVFFHGKVSSEKLKRFYQECDVFVLPAIVDRWGDTEGLGVVLLEAMSFSKPVVASNVGGIPDIVKNNFNGLLVKEKNSQQLAKAINSLLKNEGKAKKLGKQGLAFLEKNFSWPEIIRKTLAVYQS